VGLVEGTTEAVMVIEAGMISASKTITTHATGRTTIIGTVDTSHHGARRSAGTSVTLKKRSNQLFDICLDVLR